MNRFIRSFSSVLAIVTLMSAAASAKDFEGKVQFEKRVGTTVTPEVSYFKPGLMRIESAATPGAKSATKTKRKAKADDDTEAQPSGAVIMRLADKQMIILMPAQKMYMVQAFDLEKTAKNLKVEDVTFERTGRTEKIAGYECVQYLTKSSYGSTEIWAIEGMGGFMGNSGGARGGSKVASAWEAVAHGKALFPLRTITYNLKGTETERREAVSVEEQRLSDDLFNPPADYTPFKMPSLQDMFGGR